MTEEEFTIAVHAIGEFAAMIEAIQPDTYREFCKQLEVIRLIIS